MATVFSRKLAASVGTSPVNVGSYVTPSNTFDGIMEWNLINRTSSSIKASAYVKDSGNVDTYKIYQSVIGPGETLCLVTKLAVLLPGDKPYVVSDTASSLDCEIYFINKTQ